MFGLSVSTIVSILLTVLKLVGAGVAWLKERNLLDAGHDRAVAEGAMTVLSQTQTMKEIIQKNAGLSEAQVDLALKELEPK